MYRYHCFISHASEDKDSIVRDLAHKLINKGYQVFYDELSLRLGDSLRRSIDRGLSSSKYGIVILSPNFIQKEWPQQELNGLFAKEIDGKKVILPIWHNINREDIVRYSPTLADRLAVPTSLGLDYVVNQITKVLNEEQPIAEVEVSVTREIRVRQAKAFQISWLIMSLLTNNARHPVAVQEQIEAHASDLGLRLSESWTEQIRMDDGGAGTMRLMELLGGQIVAGQPEYLPYFEAGFNIVLNVGRTRGAEFDDALIRNLDLPDELRSYQGSALDRINAIHDHFEALLRSSAADR